LRDRRNSIDDLKMLLLSASDDIRTILITLCDRLWLMRHLPLMQAADAKRGAQDVLQLFAPVASRLGIYALKHEMESLAFPFLYPSDAERIHEQIAGLNRERGDFLPRTADMVGAFLTEQGILADVSAREKAPYSIFVKMRARSLTHIEDVYDLYALRVLVTGDEQCYRTLGLLHRIGRPIAHRFKDYIAFPKPNGYQSLHTTIAGLPGAPETSLIEVQVRTHTMHREAQYGVAAHWSYKEHGSAARAAERVQLSRLLVTQQAVEEEMMEFLLVQLRP
jgi:(p)ppGpp synthase/HD superfamily hydrolase